MATYFLFYITLFYSEMSPLRIQEVVCFNSQVPISVRVLAARSIWKFPFDLFVLERKADIQQFVRHGGLSYNILLSFDIFS